MRQLRIKELEHSLTTQLSRRRHLLTKIDYGKFSKAAVARHMGITASSYGCWENGISSPATFDAWQKWAAFLGMELKVELLEER